MSDKTTPSPEARKKREKWAATALIVTVAGIIIAAAVTYIVGHSSPYSTGDFRTSLTGHVTTVGTVTQEWNGEMVANVTVGLCSGTVRADRDGHDQVLYLDIAGEQQLRREYPFRANEIAQCHIVAPSLNPTSE